MVNDSGRNAEILCFSETRCIGAIAKDKGNADALFVPVLFFGLFSNGNEVGSSAGDKDDDVFHLVFDTIH